MPKSTRLWAVAVLCAAPAFIGWSMLLSHPILQNPWYHDFADQRTIFGIANFWNVVSNAAFLLVAALGLKAFRSRSAFSERWEASAYGLMLAGAAMVAFGSSYYHLSPDSDTLFWDRLPMTIVFMSLFATTIGERIDMRIGRLSLIPLLAIGIASVIYWKQHRRSSLLRRSPVLSHAGDPAFTDLPACPILAPTRDHSDDRALSHREARGVIRSPVGVPHNHRRSSVEARDRRRRVALLRSRGRAAQENRA